MKFYQYLIHRTHLPEEEQADAIASCIKKDLDTFQRALGPLRMRLQVTLLRENFRK